ncbi:MAG: BON domain-containing protein, partial [Gammaproteobacteria bacterium]
MREQHRQHRERGGGRSSFEPGHRERGRDYEGAEFEEDLGEREGRDWPREPRYSSRRTGCGQESWGTSYDEDRDRNIIDRVVREVRSWFNDDRAYGRSYGRGRGGDYPDYGSDQARSYTGRGHERDYGRDYEGESRFGGVRSGGRSAEPWSSSESEWGEERSPRTGTGFTPRTSFVYSEFWLVPGPHSGVGPKGYRRSSDRVREEICERLEQHGQIDASDIEIDVQDDGEVKLTGTVERRDVKRMVEDVAESVFGVHDVQNQIRVRRRERFGPELGRE